MFHADSPSDGSVMVRGNERSKNQRPPAFRSRTWPQDTREFDDRRKSRTALPQRQTRHGGNEGALAQLGNCTNIALPIRGEGLVPGPMSASARFKPRAALRPASASSSTARGCPREMRRRAPRSALVALDARQPLELGRHDQRFEMLAVAVRPSGGGNRDRRRARLDRFGRVSWQRFLVAKLPPARQQGHGQQRQRQRCRPRRWRSSGSRASDNPKNP